MIKLIACLFIIMSFTAFGSTDKEMRILFENYDKIVYQQKVELIDEVFTKEFLENHGGKEAFIAEVKTYPYVKPKKGFGKLIQKFKKSKLGNFFTVKAKSEDSKTSNFIVKKDENGKLKIDGTVGDG